MTRFLIKRLLLTVPVLVGVATLVFSLIHLVPGDPVQQMLGESAAPQDVALLRARLGLDRPLYEQYGVFVRGVAHGDLGTSLRTNQPVTSIILERMPATLELAFAAMLVALLVAIPLGIIAAVRAGTKVDYAATTLALVGISMPTFWLGPLLAIVFSVGLGWFPVSGRGTLAHLVLPAITLGAPLAAILARMTRASVLEELRELYVLAARARGVSETRAVLAHAFRNSLIPIVTVTGLQFGSVLTGAVITESIFAWPGIGRLLVQSISSRDYPAVQGCILLIAITYVSMNLIIDVLYGFLDPRIRYQQQSMLKLGAVIVGVALLAALVGPLIVPADASSQTLALRLTGPTLAHPFGLDELGRDILARVLAGARISFLVGFTVVIISAAFGTLLGAVAGYFGGRVDDVISRVIDVLLAFPGLLLAIALVAVLGPSLGNVLFALTIIGWVGYARLVRGQVLRAREFDYVQAARALGARSGRILWVHVIPTALPAVVVQATLGMAGAIIGEASLSFLGLGVQPPTPSWGTMLNGGRAHILDAPHLTLFPGLAIALLVLGFNFLGDGLRDRIDPRSSAVNR